MATIYFSNLASSISGYKMAFVNTRGPSSIFVNSITSFRTTVPVTSANGTTTGITDTGGGTTWKWITEPFAVAATIAGSVTAAAWISGVFVGTTQAGMTVDLAKWTAATEGASFLQDLRRSVSCNSGTLQNPGSTATQWIWTPTKPTSTAFAIGDRLVIKPAVVTLGAVNQPGTNSTVDFFIDSPDDGVSGGSYLELTENIRVGSYQTSVTRGFNLTNTSVTDLIEVNNKLTEFVNAGVIASNATVQSVLDDLSIAATRNRL